MMLKTMMSGLVVLSFMGGCGERLRHADANAPTSTVAPEAPLAKMSVQYDAAKVGADRKYTQDGTFTVSGLFYDKDGAAKDATVKVALQTNGGQTTRSYALDFAALAGTQAKVQMWDDGFLTIVIPEGENSKPAFGTSNENIKAAALAVPGQEPSTCYFGKEVLDGELRIALCDLQGQSPRLAFVDSTAEMAAEAGPVPPAAAESAAPAPAPAAPAPAN
ncbi:MAG TPA: hypothetical protein VNN80_21480 [Polyangiaceae bacterium]|nr:hypothetical protein [Polyangiaceae bacterium]